MSRAIFLIVAALCSHAALAGSRPDRRNYHVNVVIGTMNTDDSGYSNNYVGKCWFNHYYKMIEPATGNQASPARNSCPHHHRDGEHEGDNDRDDK